MIYNKRVKTCKYVSIGLLFCWYKTVYIIMCVFGIWIQEVMIQPLFSCPGWHDGSDVQLLQHSVCLCWCICVRVCVIRGGGSPWSGSLLYINAMNGTQTKHGASPNLGLFLASVQTGRHQLQSQCAHCWVLCHTQSCSINYQTGMHFNHWVPHFHSSCTNSIIIR